MIMLFTLFKISLSNFLTDMHIIIAIIATIRLVIRRNIIMELTMIMLLVVILNHMKYHLMIMLHDDPSHPHPHKTFHNLQLPRDHWHMPKLYDPPFFMMMIFMKMFMMTCMYQQ